MGGFNCVAFISREDNFHIKCPNLNSSSLCLDLQSTQSVKKCSLRKAMHGQSNAFPALWHFKQRELTSRLIHRCQIFQQRFEMTFVTPRGSTEQENSSSKGRCWNPHFRQCWYQNTTGRETNLRLPALSLPLRLKPDEKTSGSIFNHKRKHFMRQDR